MKKVHSIIAVLLLTFGMVCQGQTISGKKGGHDYVDLGFRSGLLWATCNVGATNPTEYGDYFAWGETTTKRQFNNTNYKYSTNMFRTITKYVPSYSSGEIKDDLYTLESSDDAATVNWGKDWSMPTNSDLNELINGCSWEWTEDFNGSGIAGIIGTSKFNGNIIFLPAAGSQLGAKPSTGFSSMIWSSSLSTEMSYFDADFLYIDKSSKAIYNVNRYNGLSVRAITK